MLNQVGKYDNLTQRAFCELLVIDGFCSLNELHPKAS